MAAKKYVSINAGVLTEVQSTVTSAGAGDDGKIVALDSTGRLSNTMMPVGAGPGTIYGAEGYLDEFYINSSIALADNQNSYILPTGEY